MTRRYVHAWAEDAGIANKNVTFHVSRHTYATMLLTFGVDLYTVSKLLGHTSIRHTQRYAKIVNSLKDDAISKLDNL
jgi:site-specific recombinase XerD